MPPASEANSLCRVRGKRTMCEPEVQIGISCSSRGRKHETDHLGWDFVNRSGRTGSRLSRHELHTAEKVLDVGSVHLTTETHERIPLPPILGGLALAGGSYCLSSVQGTSHSPGYGSGLDARKPAQLASIGPPRRARSLVFLIFSAMQRWIIKYFLQARPFQHAGFDIYMPIFC